MGRFLAVLVGCLILAGTIGASVCRLAKGNAKASFGWFLLSVLVAAGTLICLYYPPELDVRR